MKQTGECEPQRSTIKVDKDEYFPIYFESDVYCDEIEVTEEFIDRFRYISEEYNRIQDIIDYKCRFPYFNHETCGYDHDKI